MNKSPLNWIVAAALAGATLGTPLLASAAVELKLSHPYTETDARHQWAQEVAKLASDKTGGEVTIRIYPNQQLFKAKQQYDGVRTDRIDFAVYPMPWLSGKVKAANIGIVPGLVNSPEEGLEWRNRKVWDLLSAEVEKAGVEMISLLWSPATYAGRVAVPRTPDGVEGLKMRGMGRPLEKILAANGAAITSMPAADTYMAMQTGALDVMFSTISSFTGYSMHEVVKEIVTGPSVIYGAHFVLMSPKTEGKLTGEQFQALNEAMIEGEKIYTRLAAEEADRMAEDFSAKGVKVVTLTQEEFDAWIAEAKKHAWTDFVESTPNGQELIDAIDQPR